MMAGDRYWIVTEKGRVSRIDKLKQRDRIPDNLTWNEGGEEFSIPNRFSDKESAYAVRDKIIDLCPAAFLPEEEPKKKPGPKPKAKVVEQDEFRDMMRQSLMEHLDEFWQDFKKLRPEDKCPLYYKLFAYAYAKAPSEKVVDPAEAIKRRADAKRQAAAERISQGLDSIEDDDFED